MKLNDKNKEVLVYGINFYPELTGIGKYTGDMVDWLVSKNVKCTVITSFPYYPYWEIQKPYNVEIRSQTAKCTDETQT